MSLDPATRASVSRRLTEALHEMLTKFGLGGHDVTVTVAGPRVVVRYRGRVHALPIDLTKKLEDTEETGMQVFAAALKLIGQSVTTKETG